MPACLHGTGLLDLPTELLLQILSFHSPNELCSLAMVCRMLHDLSLPLFLISHGIVDPQQSAVVHILEWTPKIADNISVNVHPDALVGLSMDFSLKSVKHLRCYFQDLSGGPRRDLSIPFQRAAHLPFAIRRLEHFVRGLNNVRKVEISLVWDPYFVMQTAKGKDIKRGAYAPINEIQDWISSFASLLDVVMEKGCMSLTVEYDAAIKGPFKLKGMRRVMRKARVFISHNVHMLQRDANLGGRHMAPTVQWELERQVQDAIYRSSSLVDFDVIEANLLSSIAHAKPTLHSLAIHSPVLLLPPFTNWTLSVLQRHTNLTSLSFAYISFTEDVWSFLLPLIAEAVCGRLTELEVLRNCPHLDAVDLLRFLTKLPLLKKLVIDRTFRLRFQAIRHPRALFTHSSAHQGPSSLRLNHPPLPFFPELHTLQAPVELVSLLLDARSTKLGHRKSIPLPQLKSLTVYPSSLLIHPPSYVESTLVVNALYRLVLESRIQNSSPPPPIEFSLDAEMDFTDFGPVARYLRDLSRRHELQRTLLDALKDSEVLQIALSQQAGSGIPTVTFADVTHLVLHRSNLGTAGDGNADRNPRALCDYLSILFPALVRLEFVTVGRASAVRREEMGMETSGNAAEDVELVREVMKGLRIGCPTVKELILGAKTYVCMSDC